MRILSIETSCDETAISVVEARGTLKSPSFKLLSGIVHSQADLHAKWQGVVPTIAKREHAKNLVPVLERALKESGLLENSKVPVRSGKIQNSKLDLKIKKILEREEGLAESFLNFVPNIEIPKIDAVAVTYGPGLEPALWTGINFAKALSAYWKKPVVPVNHMEGHTLSALLPGAVVGVEENIKLKMPVLALLISGGHTELVLIKDWQNYKVVGHTRDDAVGEAFDKVARMLGLPYPGGPQISKMAEGYRGKKTIKLPRPMIHSDDLDFSFSGLKTSVLYKIKELGELSPDLKAELAHEFEEAVVEVLVSKTKKALEKFGVKTLIVGGGVISNKKIRQAFQQLTKENFKDVQLLIPHQSLCGDNATMIGMAGYMRLLSYKSKKTSPQKNFKAKGNLVLK
ncbi:MAG: tRNA (adenosine(37)-N6)-threonylcarbamoyltransferase complex transferase subunit TsaD [bacterium]|nr:tRNA (adenosine(37)-N6)-threonylcarbamoyltransferase complex transferase subunit TsaD [bacterium]